jgi:hypothetical protein
MFIWKTEMTPIDSEKIRALATRILKLCDGHRPSEVMTAVTLVSAFLAHDALDLSVTSEKEKFVATFADSLRIALQQDQARGTMQ